MSITTLTESGNEGPSYTTDGVHSEKLITHATDVEGAEPHMKPYSGDSRGITVQFYYDSTMRVADLRNDGRRNREIFEESNPLRSNYNRLPRVRS